MGWEKEEEECLRSIPGHGGSYGVLGAQAGAEHGSANPAAPWGEAGSSTAGTGKGDKGSGDGDRGNTGVGKGASGRSAGIGKTALGLGETRGRERGNERRILQVANSRSDTAAPAQREPISRQQPPGAAAPLWSGEPGRVNTGNEQDRHRGLTLRRATGHGPAHPVTPVSHGHRRPDEKGSVQEGPRMLPLLPTAHSPVTRRGHPARARSPPEAPALHAPETVRN